MIVDLLAARTFAQDSILPRGYHFPSGLAPAIGLTAAGEQWRDRLTSVYSELTNGDVSAVLLAVYAAGEQILVDASSSSVDAIMDVLTVEIRERRINYPFVFGRELDDRFVENFGATPIRSMTPEQTQQLLRLTPQGVFQLHEWVSGPFGLLKAAGRRHLPPQSCGPAIVCNVVQCRRIHHINMTTSPTVAGEAYSYLRKTAPAEMGLSQRLVDIALPDGEYYRVNHPGGLPWLLGNGFTQDEITKLVELGLTRHSDLRTRVNRLLGGGTAKKPPAAIGRAMNLAQMLQVLLLLDDKRLAVTIEEAIEEKYVCLSPTEIRRSFENRHLSGGYYKVDAEASHLGVRFVPSNRELTQPRTLALIRAVFTGKYQTELSWQLRNEEGGDSLEKLERSLINREPPALIKQLLFSSRDAIERAFEVLEYGRFTVPTTESAESALIEKILWKLGNPLPTPPPVQSALMTHLSDLLDQSSRDHPNSVIRTRTIRSAGMDMFVELENILRVSSEFSCWALLNDHYDVHPLHRFKYSSKRAAEFSRKLFHDASRRYGAAFSYDGNGKNTLSVLIRAFRVLADICESRLAESESHTRPIWQFPGFADHSQIEYFPLRHTALILDLRPESSRRLIDALRTVSLVLTQTDVCEVRNSLGHPRETFPTTDKLIETAQAIRAAIETLASEGLLPIIRKFAGEKVDRYERKQVRMADGDHGEVLIATPNQVMGIDLPPYRMPQIVMPAALFVNTLQPARFQVADDSEWAEFWQHVGLIDSWFGPRDYDLSGGPQIQEQG